MAIAEFADEIPALAPLEARSPLGDESFAGFVSNESEFNVADAVKRPVRVKKKPLRFCDRIARA